MREHTANGAAEYADELVDLVLAPRFLLTVFRELLLNTFAFGAGSFLFGARSFLLVLGGAPVDHALTEHLEVSGHLANFVFARIGRHRRVQPLLRKIEHRPRQPGNRSRDHPYQNKRQRRGKGQRDGEPD